MIFAIYDEQKRLYEESLNRYAEALTAKEALFALTQPTAIDYSGEKVQTGRSGNPIETYIIKLQMSNVDKALAEAESIALMRKRNLERAREELEESRELADKVYRLKFLNCKSMPEIATELNYSKRQIYRILKQISRTLKSYQ